MTLASVLGITTSARPRARLNQPSPRASPGSVFSSSGARLRNASSDSMAAPSVGDARSAATHVPGRGHAWRRGARPPRSFARRAREHARTRTDRDPRPRPARRAESTWRGLARGLGSWSCRSRRAASSTDRRNRPMIRTAGGGPRTIRDRLAGARPDDSVESASCRDLASEEFTHEAHPSQAGHRARARGALVVDARRRPRRCARRSRGAAGPVADRASDAEAAPPPRPEPKPQPPPPKPPKPPKPAPPAPPPPPEPDKEPKK